MTLINNFFRWPSRAGAERADQADPRAAGLYPAGGRVERPQDGRQAREGSKFLPTFGFSFHQLLLFL